MVAEIKLGHLHVLVLAQALFECAQICNTCKDDILRAFTSAFYGLDVEIFQMRYPRMCSGGHYELSLQRPDAELWLHNHFNEFLSPAGLNVSMQAQIWFVIKGSRSNRNPAFDTGKFDPIRLRCIRRQVVQLGERCKCSGIPIHPMNRPHQLDRHPNLMNLTW